MKQTYFTIGALVIAVITLGIIGYTVRVPIVNVSQPVIEKIFGASSGPEHWNVETFHDGFQMGGNIYSTSTTDTSATLLAANLRDTHIINFTPNRTATTLTLPATSTLSDWLKTTGSMDIVIICNATSTIDSFTLAAGTGMNLHQATSSMGIMNGDCSELTFIRNSDTDIELIYQEGY